MHMLFSSIWLFVDGLELSASDCSDIMRQDYRELAAAIILRPKRSLCSSNRCAEPPERYFDAPIDEELQQKTPKML